MVLIALLACGPAETPKPAEAPKTEAKAEAPKEAAKPAEAKAAYTAPALSEAPEGPLGDSIRRGHQLFMKTNELLPDHAPGNLSCGQCHLDEGRQLGAAALVGVAARFPKYMERTGAVITLQDRVNYCFTRSLAGSRIPVDSQEMTDLMAYLGFLSIGAPPKGKIEGIDIPVREGVQGDAARGEKLYTEKTCISCHGPEGAGTRGAFPALWGPDSYSIGASMAREERAASFIQQFMPKGQGNTLTLQEAFDLSAFINSHPRPDSPMKEKDWPKGGAPYDVPYATEGHAAFKPPPSLFPRKKPELAVVPPPAPIASSK